MPIATDIEISDFILSIFFNNGKYGYILLERIEKDLQKASIEVNGMDLRRIMKNLVQQGMIKTVPQAGDDIYIIDDNGMIIMRTHGSYSTYAGSREKKETKKEKIERADRRVKNMGILATIIISLLTLILTQCPKPTDQEQKKTEEGIQSIQKELDSLTHVLKQSITQPANKAVIDTAIHK